MTISRKAARRLALRSHLLAGPAQNGKSPAATLRTIEHLGYVQIDTISVIERAHHHVLWTRQPAYQASFLDRLLAKDRTVFENWTHAASYVPMRDYRFYTRRMARVRDSERTKTWSRANRKVVDHVLDRIRDEGPLISADFKDPREKRGRWWDWKPAKRALELLFDSGELMVRERRGFQRVYDLSENVLPSKVDTSAPTDAEWHAFVIRRALNLFGLLPQRDIWWWRRRNREQVVERLRELVEDGEVAEVRVQGMDKGQCYALTDALDASAGGRINTRQMHILSPFDSVTIRRHWLASLFDFEYRLECYYPQRKRQFGYFTLPILKGDTFVGRLDAKADRKMGRLLVKRLWFEERIRDYSDIAGQLGPRLWDFARLNGCDRVTLGTVTPRAARDTVKASLACA